MEEAWQEADAAIMSGKWDLVVLDEINYAITYGMLDPAKVVETLKQQTRTGARNLDGEERASDNY